ncbi:MAG: hypothetical protein ACI4RR_06015 [Eubacterium sp.]
MLKVKQFVTENVEKLKIYWSKPPLGRYMPFKEIASLAFGGMGVKFICYAVQMMLLSVGNTLIGNTIGIPPQPLYLIYIISIIASFPLTAVRAKWLTVQKTERADSDLIYSQWQFQPLFLLWALLGCPMIK